MKKLQVKSYKKNNWVALKILKLGSIAKSQKLNRQIEPLTVKEYLQKIKEKF